MANGRISAMVRADLAARLRAALLGFGVAIVAHASPAAAETVRVRIENFAFNPATVTVKAGTVVTFENDDDSPHTVVATDGSFRSSALDTGGAYSFTFTKPGDFPYFCSLHPHMQGTISVAP